LRAVICGGSWPPLSFSSADIESMLTSIKYNTCNMPELPEVETVKRGLDRLLPGKLIIAEKHDWPKGFPNTEADVSEFLIGSQIQSVQRRGKALVINLNTGYSLLIHLKMTGQLVFVPNKSDSAEGRFGAGHPNDSLIKKLPDKSTRVTLSFKDGSHLYFNDQRKFGWMKLLPVHAIEEEPFIKKLGPEPLDGDFTHKKFIQRLKKRPNTNIKAALLDQTVLAGVGNIYADESLWSAGVHPTRVVKTIPDKELQRLHKELIDVLRLSIDKGGSTDRSYVDAEGQKGSYLKFAKVFRREGQLCVECDNTILKTRVAGRGTHTCSVCQPTS